jgi:hypothetical protein
MTFRELLAAVAAQLDLKYVLKSSASVLAVHQDSSSVRFVMTEVEDLRTVCGRNYARSIKPENVLPFP